MPCLHRFSFRPRAPAASVAGRVFAVAALGVALSVAMPGARAQQALPAAPLCCAQPAGVVRLVAGASAALAPDRAVATFAAVRQGPDVAALNTQVASLLDAAVKTARAVPGVEVQTGGFQTSPHDKVAAGQVRQDGWTVRAQLTVKSADFAALGRLAAQLAQTLQVQGTGTEMSIALQAREQARLTQMAIANFRIEAQAAARDFGYAGYTLREVDVSPLQGASPAPRPMFRAMAAPGMEAPGIPIEAGLQTLSVTVSGAVQLQR